jgi:hypothetical protein
MYQFQLLLWQKKLIDEKINVKKQLSMKIGIKSDFNCEIDRIKELDVKAGQRQLDMEKK